MFLGLFFVISLEINAFRNSVRNFFKDFFDHFDNNKQKDFVKFICKLITQTISSWSLHLSFWNFLRKPFGITSAISLQLTLKFSPGIPSGIPLKMSPDNIFGFFFMEIQNLHLQSFFRNSLKIPSAMSLLISYFRKSLMQHPFIP